jgi:lipopolysaccharide export system protein LptC
MDHEKLVQMILTPLIVAIVAMIGWSLVSVIELKEEVATVKADVKYISKQVDAMSEKLAFIKETEIYAKQ